MCQKGSDFLFRFLGGAGLLGGMNVTRQILVFFIQFPNKELLTNRENKFHPRLFQ
jgi:hypothetical protein